jgi:hypothetical protein
VGAKQTVYLTYRVQKGDRFSTSSWSNISLAVLDAAGAANEPVDVFIGKRSYRLDATNQMFTIGYSHGLDELCSYELSVRYLRSKTKVDLGYQGIVCAQVIFSAKIVSLCFQVRDSRFIAQR